MQRLILRVNKKIFLMKTLNVVGDRPNFMKIALIMKACKASEAIKPPKSGISSP